MIRFVKNIMNIIPYVGPLLGAIPAVIIFYLKFKSVNMLFYIIAGFAIVQFFDNLLLKPIIYSQSVDLNPVLVMFALLLGGSIGGIWGLIFAIPIAGIIKVIVTIVSKEISSRLKNKELPS